MAGPEPIRQDELVPAFLKCKARPTDGTIDPKALYSGAAINDQSLTPGDKPILVPRILRTGSPASRNTAKTA